MPRTNGTTTQRGYDAKHKAERARWVPIVARGGAACARCGEPIVPPEPWDLGHTDDRRAWTGPEHQDCNRADGARKRNARARDRADGARKRNARARARHAPAERPFIRPERTW